MKKIIVSLVAIAAITFSAQAQTQRNKNNKEQNESKKNHSKPDHKQLDAKFRFTDDQKQQMKSINMDFKNKMQELKNSNLTAEELKAKKTALQQERRRKTMALLTPEQKNKMKEFKKERHGKGKMNSAKRM